MRRRLLPALAAALLAACAPTHRPEGPAPVLPGSGTPGGPPGGPASATRQSAAEPVLRDHSTLEFGQSTPSGAYANMPSQRGFVYFTEPAITPVFNAGQGATKGGFLAYHHVSYLGFDLQPQFKVGIDVGLAAAYAPVDWPGIYRTTNFETNVGDGMLDATIGPVFSYTPGDKLAFDISLRGGYGVAGGSKVVLQGYPLSDGSIASVGDSNDNPASGPATAFGVRARYGAFMLGWEAHSNGGPRLRSYTVTTSGKTNRQSNFNYTINSPMPTSRLSFGFVF